MLTIALFAAASLASAAAPQAPESVEERISEAAGIRVDEARNVFSAIRRAVLTDDRKAFASLVAYPLTVRFGERKMVFRNPVELVDAYPTVMTESVRKAVAAQRFDKLFVSWQGIMIGHGQIWFGGVCPVGTCSSHEVRILAIQPDAPDVGSWGNR